MNAETALWGFCQWLCGRPNPTTFCLSKDASVARELVDRFLEANELNESPIVNWPDELRHGESIYADSDRSNGGQSIIQLEAMHGENGDDFDDSIPKGWGLQDHAPDDPVSREDMEQLIYFLHDVLNEKDYLTLHLILELILDPESSLSKWANKHEVSPQAASQRLRRAKERNDLVAKIVRPKR